MSFTKEYNSIAIVNNKFMHTIAKIIILEVKNIYYNKIMSFKLSCL